MSESVLNYDPRRDDPMVQEVSLDSLLSHRIVKIKYDHVPDYKLRCLEGMSHPLNIEEYHYELVNLGGFVFNSNFMFQYPGLPNGVFNNKTFLPEEVEFIRNIAARPEIEWAVENSFDGLYIKRHQDPLAFNIHFNFAAYFTAEHATFWRMKFR